MLVFSKKSLVSLMRKPWLETGLKKWFKRYNTWRPHEALGNLTPDVVHAQGGPRKKEEKAA